MVVYTPTAFRCHLDFSEFFQRCHFAALAAKVARFRVNGFGLFFSSAVVFPVRTFSALNLPLLAGLM